MRPFALPLVFVASTAAAQMGPIPGEEKFAALAEAQEGVSGSAGAGLMFGQLGDEDYFLQVSPRFDLNLGPVGLGLQVPLNLRVWDRDPQNDDDIAGIIRPEDWDEFSDYLKVIRYLRYGYKNSGLVYARVGEIAADLGHGTIMGRYMNNIDIDTFRLGSQLDVYTDYGGVETVVSDYGAFAGSPASRLVGVRAYVKPYAFVGDPESWLNMFSVGLTMATDLNAPRRLDGAFGLDEDNNLEVATEAAQTVYGFDIEARVLDTELIQITPYMDTNFISNAGWGWHLGTAFQFRLPFVFDIVLPARLEYRRFSSDYIPTYFSSFYEIERYAFVPAGGAAPPKAAYVRSLGGGDGLNGIYGDAAFNFGGFVQIGALYEDYSDGDIGGNFAAFLSVPALEAIQFKAYYTRTDVDGITDLFALDNKSLLIAEARFEIFMYTYQVGRFSRRWVPNPSAPPAFTSEDDWNVGLEMSFNF
jgi:hypothetical protein